VTEIIAMVALTVQTLILTIIVISVYRQSQHIKQSEEAQAAKESTAEKIPAPHITPEELERLRQSTQQVFEKAVNDSAEGFHADLAATSQKLNELITRLTTQVVERELDEYRQGLTTGSGGGGIHCGESGPGRRFGCATNLFARESRTA
jgi:hypothetical protein